MAENLSDQELRVATWLFLRRPIIIKYTLMSLLIIFLLITGVALLLGSWYLSGIYQHTLRVKAATLNLAAGVDPALDFLPRNLQVEEIRVIKHSRGGASFVAKVTNPNDKWLAFGIKYFFVIDGESNNVVKTAFVLPGSSRYLAGFKPDDTSFTNIDIDWSEITWYKTGSVLAQELIGENQVTVNNVEIKRGDRQLVVDSVRANLYNAAPFGFWSVPVVALIYNSNKQLIGVGEGQVPNFLYQQQQTVDIGLGYLDAPEAERLEAEIIPAINIFDKSSIIYL